MKRLNVGWRETAIFAGTAGAVAIGIILCLSPEKREEPIPPAPHTSRQEEDPAPNARHAAANWRNLSDWRAGLESTGTGGLSALTRMALSIEDESLRATVLAELVREWIDRDISTFLEFIDEAEVDETEDDRIWQLLAPALMEGLPKIGDRAAESRQLREVIERLIVNYAPENPSRALDWARQWLHDRELHAAIVEIAPELARTSPAEGIALADSLPPSLRRMEAFAGVGAVLAESNPTLGIVTANTLSNPAESAFMMGSVLRTMASKQPRDAAREFAIYREKLESDFVAQMERERRELGVTAEDEFFGLSAEDARAARRSSPNVQYIDDAAAEIAAALAKSDLPGTFQWIESLPKGNLQVNATAAVYSVWAAESPEAALAHYAASEESHPKVSEALFETWAGVDPESAAAALPRLSGKDRMPSVEAVARGWIDRETPPAIAQDWADRLPAATERDAATAIIVEAAAFDHPEFAWEKAQQIGNPRKRRMALQDAFESLAESDPSAARKALSNIELTPDQAQDFALILRSAEE